MPDNGEMSAEGLSALEHLEGPELFGGKDVNPNALASSVIQHPTVSELTSPPGGDSNIIFFAAEAADTFPPWGLRPKERDRKLREFIGKETVFSSALGLVSSRNAAFGWSLEGPPRSVKVVQDILENANSGQGWLNFISKISMDLYSQDAGAFIEIVRAGENQTSAFVGLNHLDAYRCYHTGVPTHPVLYQDQKSKWHLLPWWNVAELSEMPTAVEGMHGLQYSAQTLLMEAAQIIRNISIYKREKTGGRHNRAIHLVQGLTTKQINASMEQYRIFADAAGALRYVNPIIVGGIDPSTPIDVKTLELASLPDGFDEETSFKHYIAMIAMAFKSDYQEFAPLPGGNLGTSQQSEILHLKSRGKGPALFMKLLSHAINFRMLPRNVRFKFVEQDVEQEEAEARIRTLRAEERSIRIMSGEISPDESRQLAVDKGDMPLAMFEEGGGSDVTPDIAARDDATVRQQQSNAGANSQNRKIVISGQRGIPEEDPDFEFQEGYKQLFPFEDQRKKDVARLTRAVSQGLRRIEENVRRRIRREGNKELAGYKVLADIPNDSLFWATQQGEMFDALAGNNAEFQDFIFQGVDQATQLGLVVDFAMINETVFSVAQTFENTWWNQVEATTRNNMRTAIQTHIASGEGLGALNKRLTPLFGKERAEMIASTEVTRLYAEGNKAAYKSAGIEEDQWQTVRDALVDPDCDALDGQRRKRDGRTADPPLHVRCRCWIAPVVNDQAIKEPKPDLSEAPSIENFEPNEAQLRMGDSKNFEKWTEQKFGANPVAKRQSNSGVMYHGKDYAATVKDGVVKDLSARSGLKYDDVNTMVQNWAASSSDNNPVSIALQRAASEEFGLELTPFIRQTITNMEAEGGLSALGSLAETREKARKFVNAVYESTQEFFRQQGIKSVRVLRGMRFEDRDFIAQLIKEGDDFFFNPLSSFSSNPFISSGFGERGGLQIAFDVPVEHIWSSALTGPGCLTEYEFIVLGGRSVPTKFWSTADVAEFWSAILGF